MAEDDQAADNNADKKQIGRPFVLGQVANPAGRPKGSRNKLGEVFIQALHADFEAHGEKVIEAVRKDKPAEYLKVVASLLPKQVEIREGAFDGVDDEQLAALVAAARSALGVTSSGTAGTEKPQSPQQAKALPAIH